MGGELSFSAGALALLKSRKAAIHNPDDQDTDAAPGIKGSYAQIAFPAKLQTLFALQDTPGPEPPFAGVPVAAMRLPRTRHSLRLHSRETGEGPESGLSRHSLQRSSLHKVAVYEATLSGIAGDNLDKFYDYEIFRWPVEWKDADPSKWN